jgi:hypothetical protein
MGHAKCCPRCRSFRLSRRVSETATIPDTVMTRRLLVASLASVPNIERETCFEFALWKTTARRGEFQAQVGDRVSVCCCSDVLFADFDDSPLRRVLMLLERASPDERTVSCLLPSSREVALVNETMVVIPAGIVLLDLSLDERNWLATSGVVAVFYVGVALLCAYCAVNVAMTCCFGINCVCVIISLKEFRLVLCDDECDKAASCCDDFSYLTRPYTCFICHQPLDASSSSSSSSSSKCGHVCSSCMYDSLRVADGGMLNDIQ